MSRDRIVDRLCEVAAFLDGLYAGGNLADRWPREVEHAGVDGRVSRMAPGEVTHLTRIHVTDALCALGRDDLYLAAVNAELAERYTASFARAMAAPEVPA